MSECRRTWFSLSAGARSSRRYGRSAGETDKAFEIIEKAYRERDDTILMIKRPRLDPVKSDPRYAELLRRIGLPPG